MIRPCDNCDGIGCPRCAGMPLLEWSSFSTWVWNKFEIDDDPKWYEHHEPRKPEPTTVMRWCSTHRSAVTDYDDRCHYSCCWKIWKYGGPDCKLVWVENPTPLEETNDGKRGGGGCR